MASTTIVGRFNFRSGSPSPVAQQVFGFIEWTRNDVDRDQLADPPRRHGARVSCGFDGTNVAADQNGDIAVKQVFLTDQNHVGRLDHGVCRLYRSDKTKRLHHAKGIHGLGTYQNRKAKAIDCN